MDVSILIKQRLEELKLEQKDLAAAARVTESYISQLLTGKKLPPAPERTDIYEKMSMVLKLPGDKLARLAELQRMAEWKRTLAEPPVPLLSEVRDLVLGKCAPEQAKQIRAIFEKEPFGELERLVTQRLLDVVKRLATEELENETWLRLVARLTSKSYEQIRVMILEFLDADVFSLSPESCASFLDPLIESWSIDLGNFGMDIVLNRRLVPEHTRRYEFVEKEPERRPQEEPGLEEFLRDPSLSREATDEEIEFLKKLRFKGKRPTALYYYRELQNLRDPLHFRVG
ncbi:MAG: helix-turn-helix transcriptional regulator [Candidatus Krumholzibacteria bacterium]|nr:helix-turn-helix transcriptional regulator [Candidatus Krumholzibacteria bacterium]MDH4336911.1 helix-turn-helix transcriptional regulator [Candidatus Krumholzibacteria bacterium]MDH5269793.1 helix-turn-helix transcriptional regulator [Candidatus Krumholzibacteria bacterium]